eukprot:6368625-Prymnesium_polylepis.1
MLVIYAAVLAPLVPPAPKPVCAWRAAPPSSSRQALVGAVSRFTPCAATESTAAESASVSSEVGSERDCSDYYLPMTRYRVYSRELQAAVYGRDSSSVTASFAAARDSLDAYRKLAAKVDGPDGGAL